MTDRIFRHPRAAVHEACKRNRAQVDLDFFVRTFGKNRWIIAARPRRDLDDLQVATLQPHDSELED